MLDRLADFLMHHTAQGPSAPARIRLNDEEALELLAAVGPAGVAAMKFPEQLTESSAELSAAIAAAPALTGDHAASAEALARWAHQYTAASSKLWDALAGEVVNGVEIVRKAP